MSKKTNPIDSLERVFHEPKRLSILSTVAASEQGVSFNELKESCDVTDGNLNRHLKMLEAEKIVRLKKVLADGRARTLVFLTSSGRKKFMLYLESLESVLHHAIAAVGKNKAPSPATGFKPSMAN